MKRLVGGIIIVLLGKLLPGSSLADWKGYHHHLGAPRWPDENDDKFHWIKGKIAEFEELNPGVKVD